MVGQKTADRFQVAVAHLERGKGAKKETAFNLWLACHTQEEIADSVDSPQQTIADWMKAFAETSISEESVKWTDFEVPIYNVWKQQTKSNKVDHFGNSEPRCRGCCEAGFQRILTLLRPQHCLLRRHRHRLLRYSENS